MSLAVKDYDKAFELDFQGFLYIFHWILKGVLKTRPTGSKKGLHFVGLGIKVPNIVAERNFQSLVDETN